MVACWWSGLVSVARKFTRSRFGLVSRARRFTRSRFGLVSGQTTDLQPPFEYLPHYEQEDVQGSGQCRDRREARAGPARLSPASPRV